MGIFIYLLQQLQRIIFMQPRMITRIGHVMLTKLAVKTPTVPKRKSKPTRIRNHANVLW